MAADRCVTRTFLRCSLSALVAFSLLLGVSAVAGAGALAPDTENPQVQAAAASWYAAHYGVALDTARERLQIQDDASLVLGDAVAALGTSFAGAWYDPSDGGRLKIAVASSQGSGAVPSGANVDSARQALVKQGVDQYADFVGVNASWDDLAAAQQLVNERLATTLPAGSFRTSLDPTSNSVRVTAADDLTPGQSAAVQSVAAAATLPAGATAQQPIDIRLSTAKRSTLVATANACAFLYGGQLYCDPALRGGVVIGSTYDQCTAGFLVKSLSDSKPYVLTAGHCLYGDGGTQWSTHFSDGSLHGIGYRHSWTWGSATGGSGDYGIIGIDNVPGWGLTNNSYVWVGPSAGGTTTQNSFYSITGVGTSVRYMVICTTGGIQFPNGYHTDCGSVTDLNVSGTESVGGVTSVVTGLGRANTCNGVDGNSGGPYFKNGLGYGIHSGAVGTCDVFYQGLGGALGSSLGLL